MALVGGGVLFAGGAPGGGTLRIAMTASDVPTTTGAPDNGYEGVRFLGYPVYEGLVLWDLSHADKLAEIRPGPRRKLGAGPERQGEVDLSPAQGVKFHDGSDFNADAAIWNIDRYFKRMRRNSIRPAARSPARRNPLVKSYRKIDDYTIEITNPRPLSYFPNALRLHALFQPGAVREDGLMGRVRQAALRHRARSRSPSSSRASASR